MINQEGDQKGIFGHPQTSFFETIDEPRVIVLVRITEVRIMEKRSLTLDPSKPPLFAFECPLDILIEPLSTPIMGISLPSVAVTS